MLLWLKMRFWLEMQLWREILLRIGTQFWLGMRLWLEMQFLQKMQFDSKKITIRSVTLTRNGIWLLIRFWHEMQSWLEILFWLYYFCQICFFSSWKFSITHQKVDFLSLWEPRVGIMVLGVFFERLGLGPDFKNSCFSSLSLSFPFFDVISQLYQPLGNVRIKYLNNFSKNLQLSSYGRLS